jgi:hypothetical protein
MTTQANESASLPMVEQTVFCRRAGRDFTVAEHAECAYCFGKSEEIATGVQGEFCDFRRGVDRAEAGFHKAKTDG